MSTVLAVSAGTHQSFLNENTCTYIMLWSSGMKLVAFPDARPDAVLLLLAAIGLAVLLLICNTHTHTKPEQLESHFTHKCFLMRPATGGKHATCSDPDTFNWDQWQTLLRERERERGEGGEERGERARREERRERERERARERGGRERGGRESESEREREERARERREREREREERERERDLCLFSMWKLNYV